MAVTAAQVKELRERTGIGMMECKKALETTNGDIEAAIEELRKKGLASAAKKADRDTSEGYINIVEDGNDLYLVSIGCETDFLAKSEWFQKFLDTITDMFKSGKSEDEIEKFKQESVLELGENLVIKELKKITAPSLGYYIHSNGKLAGVVTSDNADTDSEKLKHVAMHAVAMNPEYLSPEDISEEDLTKEKEIQLAQMKNDPKMAEKPDNVLEKIIEGKMGKFKSDNSLLEQPFVMDSDKKVKDYIGKDNVSAFYRFSI